MINRKQAITLVQTKFIDPENEREYWDTEYIFKNKFHRYFWQFFKYLSNAVEHYNNFLDKWFEPDKKQFLTTMGQNPKTKLVIHPKYVHEFSEGWMISWGSYAWMYEEDSSYILYGDAPVIVDKDSGKLYFTGTLPFNYTEDYIRFKKGEPAEKYWEEWVGYET